jgi:hypothetical protein
MSHTVTIIVLLIGLTLFFSSMMHLHDGSSQQPSNISSSSITLEGRQYLYDLSQRSSELAKDQAFLTDVNPSISRIHSHQRSCASFSAPGAYCSCNEGAYSFANIDDVEAQLLKPGTSNAVKSKTRLTPNTVQGLDTFRMVFGTCSTGGADTLESVVSIDDVAPGADRGTGNL